MCVCVCVHWMFSGFNDLMYVDLYDGDDCIVTKMVEAGFAAETSVSPDMMRFHQEFDDNSDTVPSSNDDNLPKYILVPG